MNVIIDIGHTSDHAREHPVAFKGIDWTSGKAKEIADKLGFTEKTSDSVEHLLNKAFAKSFAAALAARNIKNDTIDWPWMANNAEISKVVNHVNSVKPDLLVSIHANASGSSKWTSGASTASGTVVLYYPTSSKGKQLARIVGDKCKLVRKRLDGPDNRFEHIAPSSVAVIAKTCCTAILVETCFYDNIQDLYWTTKHLDDLAAAVADGILTH